jgi:hypothetical protein
MYDKVGYEKSDDAWEHSKSEVYLNKGFCLLGILYKLKIM